MAPVRRCPVSNRRPWQPAPRPRHARRWWQGWRSDPNKTFLVGVALGVFVGVVAVVIFG